MALLDLSYLDEVLTAEQARSILAERRATREQRRSVIEEGYPGYDTSVGWTQYSDDQIRSNARRSVDQGFTAVKLKVGSPNPQDDLRRVALVREAVGDQIKIMVDANQAWSLPQALAIGQSLRELDLVWIEEPTQPDDVLAHQRLARELAPVAIAVGESIPNRIVWKNFLQAAAVGIVQADCTRLAGVSEYLAVAILATQYPVKLIPHVGDMGQIHQHLVFFNHIGLGHRRLFLESIPHLSQKFRYPARVADGLYAAPQDPGAGCEIRGQ